MFGMLRGLLARCAYWVNDVFPGVKSLIPRRLHRFMLIRIVGMNEPYEQMLRTNPERLFLQGEALPWVAANYRKVLFVGTASYTHQYEELFADDPDRYTTIDHSPTAKVWGARHHIVAPIQEIGRHRPPGFFDCIVLSGVLGFRFSEETDFGPIGQDELRSLLATLHTALRRGGLLLVGWNLHDMPQSLHERGLLEPYFAPADRAPWGRRKAFPGDPHVFEFYERR